MDSLVHDKTALNYLIQLMGSNRICLGTDYPFPLGELDMGAAIRSATLSAADQEWVYHRAALEWLGLTAADFGGPLARV